MNDSRAAARYPLSALFYVIAATAVVISLVAPVFTSMLSRNVGMLPGNVGSFIELVGWSVGLGLVGGVLGFFMGLYHYRRLRGVGWGVLSGLMTGTCLGPVAVSRDFDQVASNCVSGGLLLILIGAFCRISSRRVKNTR